MRVVQWAVRITLCASLALGGCASVGTPRHSPQWQFTRGVRLLNERPAGENVPAGIRLIRRAARNNLALAQDRLGLMYLQGWDVPTDTARGMKWIRRAAERGAPAAELQLGNLYRAGRKVPRSWTRAYYWYAIAAKPVRGDVHILNSAQVRAFARRLQRQVAVSLSIHERARILRRVARWHPLRSVPYSGWVMLGSPSAR
jgi:hypothetical protein